MTIPTTLPVPSQSPTDLLFNAEKFDEIVNSSALTYTDRLGVQRKTAAGAAAALAVVNPRGAWATGTLYAPRDLVSNSGTWYISLDTHTSGATFSGDQTAHWRVYQGVISSDLAASTGAGLSGYDKAGSYSSATVGKKLHQIVHIEDDGAVGNGTADDEVPLLAVLARALARGVPAILDGTKTYAVDAASWSIAAGTRLQTNGATIKCLTTSTGNTVWLTIGDNCVIDELNVSIPTGVRRDRAILVDGDDARIGKLKLHSVDQQANTEADDGGVQVTGLRPYIGILDIKNYDRPLIVRNTTTCTILRVLLENYVRGFYGYDNVGLKVGGGRIFGASPNTTNAAGSNGVLLGCTSTDAQRNCVFEDVVVEDSGEHAWRVGGPERQSNLRFSDCSAYNIGGCGFKVLGTDAGIPTTNNVNIVVENFIAEDCGKDAALSATNRVGLLFKFVQGLQVDSPIVRKRNQAVSAQYGMVVDGVIDANVTSHILNDAANDGFLAWASDGDVQYLNVNGGTSRANGRYGVYLLVDSGKTMNRPVIDGVNFDGNTGNAFRVNVSGTLQGGFLRAKSTGNAGTGQSNSTNVTLQLVTNGTEVGATPLSGISARNGSWCDDGTNFSIRKGGAWVAL